MVEFQRACRSSLKQMWRMTARLTVVRLATCAMRSTQELVCARRGNEQSPQEAGTCARPHSRYHRRCRGADSTSDAASWTLLHTAVRIRSSGHVPARPLSAQRQHGICLKADATKPSSVFRLKHRATLRQALELTASRRRCKLLEAQTFNDAVCIHTANESPARGRIAHRGGQQRRRNTQVLGHAA
jgi:hypothetical protein